MKIMIRSFYLLVLTALVAIGLASAQQQPQKPLPPSEKPPRSDAPPRSDEVRPDPIKIDSASSGQSQTDPARPAQSDDRTFSSSRDTIIDLSPPRNDAKEHPESTDAVEDATGVTEMHPWNPHRAMKDIEVGDFYFKRKNYRAALDRYREALLYKPDDAAGAFHVGQCEEKLGDAEGARTHYEAYLKVLPEGPFAEEARKGLGRLKTETSGGEKDATKQ